MNNVNSEWAESHFPLYTAAQILSLYGTSNQPMHKIHEDFTVLIAIAGGKGVLRLDDQTFELQEGSIMLIPAQVHAALVTNSLQPLHAYKLSIGIWEPPTSPPASSMVRRSEVLGGSNLHFFLCEPDIVAKVEELYLYRSPIHEARHVKNQIVFHQIIAELLEREDAKYAVSDQPSMDRSITYLENHFSEKITREQLAALAGISSSHYSILFKRLTGFSPQEYLSRLRVHRAIELLISGSGTLREIAQKVGYKDEFYLSRRFKRQTGAAPSAYNRRSSLPRVAVVLTPYASHLLLLGLEPVVTIAENGEYVNIAELEKPQNMRFISADASPEQLNSVLLETKSELIIAAQQHLHRFGLNLGHMRAVAPVIEISWMELSWKEHFRLIAQAIQRSERAEEWLAMFEEEEQEARLQVQESAVVKETITILILRPEQMQVYGARNVGYVMYHSLGLKPPAKIGQEIERLGNQFHSIPIELAELADYAGDRLLVFVFPDPKGSFAHADAILQSSYWKGLSAVRNDKVHHLDIDEWIPYNPVSIRLQLQRAVALFTGIQ
ncbi:helix-turn-helix domain-containing protein [Paenibacillus sp. NPDC056722]|uniref:helix-turn-helix domain-containing protein n=1 Tax=Paenibacillus sp. NPDC056722 TaxID=3345924 RepID=UPI003692D202